MCLLHCNATADKGLKIVWRAGHTNIEANLAILAAGDTVEQENGLGQLTHPVADWAKNNTLCKVRKYRTSGHRFYFVGTHKDCNYHLRFVLPNKRAEDDKPKDWRYRNRVLNAVLDEDICRTLPATPPADDED